MNVEPLVESIVRSVLQRLGNNPTVASTALNETEPIQELYQQYRNRYLHTHASEERFLLNLDASVRLEWGEPAACIYEKDRPCDLCGRCEVRGF